MKSNAKVGFRSFDMTLEDARRLHPLFVATQLIDQTGEIAYWFFVVARQMEKAELAGKLA